MIDKIIIDQEIGETTIDRTIEEITIGKTIDGTIETGRIM